MKVFQATAQASTDYSPSSKKLIPEETQGLTEEELDAILPKADVGVFSVARDDDYHEMSVIRRQGKEDETFIGRVVALNSEAVAKAAEIIRQAAAGAELGTPSVLPLGGLDNSGTVVTMHNIRATYETACQAYDERLIPLLNESRDIMLKFNQQPVSVIAAEEFDPVVARYMDVMAACRRALLCKTYLVDAIRKFGSDEMNIVMLWSSAQCADTAISEAIDVAGSYINDVIDLSKKE